MHDQANDDVSPLRKPDEAHDYAMNLLCDLYDDLGHYKKKAALLQGAIDTTRRSPLRRAGLAHDEGPLEFLSAIARDPIQDKLATYASTSTGIQQRS